MHALVVDDNVDLAANVAELLEALGLEIHLAHDGESAIAIASARRIDLAIVDLRLPHGTSGVELVPRLREGSPDVEIIVVTGNATLDSAVAAVRHGIFAYVQKPFGAADFLGLARRALALVQARRDRQRLSAELARSEAMHRNLVETVDAAILVLDPRGQVRFANRFASERSGGSSEGRTFLEAFVAPDERIAVARRLREPQGDRVVRSIEATTPGGADARSMRWSFSPAGTSEADGSLVVGVDVTDLRELQRRTAEAEALGAVGVLTTGLAHEIRNPLNAASLQLELLVRAARRVDDPTLRAGMEDRVRIVRTELARLERMLGEFLSLARPKQLDVVDVDLASVVDEVVELQQPLAEAQGAALSHAVVAGAHPVRVDVARIKQVLINLVGNALDALRPSGAGQVRIEAGAMEGRVVVRVLDDGPGIGLEAGDAFQPFVTTKEGGTGLGLSIVRTIVEQHGGQVTLARREPRGTSVAFTVPVAG